MHLHDIAFYLALFFIIGIAAAGLGLNIWIIILASLALGLSGFLFHKRKLALVFTFITFLGFFYFNFNTVLQSENIPFGERVVLEGIVFKQPRHGLRSEQLDIRLDPPHKGEIKVYSEPATRFEYGDVLEIDGIVEKSPTGNQNISSFPKITVVREGSGNILKANLFKSRNNLIENLNKVLPPQHAALMSGILFGERAEFTDEFENAMQKSGTTHIVALSGYNVAIIGITLSVILSYLIGRRYAFYASLAAIPAFVVMTGAEASVVRAGIMGIILLLAEKQSRIYSFRNAITFTALVMLLVDPKLLVFDLGFQLSFAALLGIVYLYPFFKKWFHISEGGALGWRRNLFQTLSAQLAVAPIILTSFGYFSPTALFANVLILEFIPITMLLGFLTAVLGFLPFGVSISVKVLLKRNSRTSRTSSDLSLIFFCRRSRLKSR